MLGLCLDFLDQKLVYFDRLDKNFVYFDFLDRMLVCFDKKKFPALLDPDQICFDYLDQISICFDFLDDFFQKFVCLTPHNYVSTFSTKIGYVIEKNEFFSTKNRLSRRTKKF